jgi:spore coat polysaccharide biosynthesis protein SpsF
MRIIAVTQARTGSTRLPSKVLMQVSGVTLLELHINRILKSKKIDQLIVATTLSPEDLAIVDLAKKLGVNSYQGSVSDVLDRFYQSLKGLEANYIVRLTSDCPLIDPVLIDKVIEFTVTHNLDYCSNTLDPSYPDGQDVEVFKYTALERAWSEANLISEREHVTPYIWKNSSYQGGKLFSSDNFKEGYSYGHLRMTVDEPKDFEVISKLVETVGLNKGWLEYAQYLDGHQEVKSINQMISRNEGYEKSTKKEK